MQKRLPSEKKKQTFPQVNMKLFVILFVANLATTFPHPAPQSEDENSVDSRIVNVDLENSDADDRESSDSNFGEILGLFGQIGSDLVSLAREKGKLVRSLLEDKELRERVGILVAAGVNGTQQLVKSSGPVVDQIRRSFTNTNRLAGNVVKAVGETAPLAQETLEEYGNQAPLLTGIARSYAEINIENAQNVVKAFHESLRCNTQCGNFEEGEQKEECREMHCKPEET